jgi:hypothetical protein
MRSYAYPITFFNTTYFAILALWAALWLSLNAESATSEDQILVIFHQCRLLLPYGAALVGVFWICKLRAMPRFQIWQVGVLGYAGTVLISSVIAGIEYQNFHFHAAMVCATIVTICVNTLAHNSKHLEEKQIVLTLMFAGLVLLAAAFTIFFLRDLVVAMQHNIYNGYAVHGMVPETIGMEAPRPTGNARTAVIIGLFCLISYCFGIFKHRVFYFVACFCLTAVIFYQARASMVALAITIGLLLQIIPTNCRPSLLDSIKFCVIVVSMLLTIWLVIHLPNHFEQSTTFSDKPRLFRDLIGVDSFSNGRFDFWVSGLEAFFGSPYFGLGGQADRLHIDHNVSSLLLYILMCGGIMGLAFAVVTVLRPIKLIWSLTRCKSILKRDPESGITISAIAIFVFLSVRGIFENSYSLFNIDFLLVMPVVWHLHLQHKKMRGYKSGNNLPDRASIQ